MKLTANYDYLLDNRRNRFCNYLNNIVNFTMYDYIGKVMLFDELCDTKDAFSINVVNNLNEIKHIR